MGETGSAYDIRTETSRGQPLHQAWEGAADAAHVIEQGPAAKRFAERFFGVAEDVEVPGEPGRANQFIQGRAAGEVALSVPEAVSGEEVTDASLEEAETHCLSSPARRKAFTSPCRWMLSSTRSTSSLVAG